MATAPPIPRGKRGLRFGPVHSPRFTDACEAARAGAGAPLAPLRVHGRGHPFARHGEELLAQLLTVCEPGEPDAFAGVAFEFLRRRHLCPPTRTNAMFRVRIPPKTARVRSYCDSTRTVFFG